MAKIAFTSIMFIVALFAMVAAVAIVPKALRNSLTFIREFRILQRETQEEITPKDEK